MMNQENKAIRCTVKQCAHHAANADCCALDHITVGPHEANPCTQQCVDCMSFTTMH